MEGIPEKIDSKFRFVLLAAQRAEQLMRGAQPRLDTIQKKPTTVAMKEVQNDAIGWDYGQPEPPEAEALEELEGLHGEEGAPF